MYHVECIDIRKNDPLYPYLDRASLCANSMYNVSNFYIRNLMTGLKKDPSMRTVNERAVIDTVSGSISGINEKLREKYEIKIRNIQNAGGLSEQEKAEKAAGVRYLQFSMPTAEKWFAFRYTGNEDYRSFHVHVMQNAVKACCEAWKGYFEALKAFSPSSGSTGRPRIPGYKKPGGRSTAVFSNIACSIKHGVLFFPCYREDGPSGRKRKRCSIPVAGLPHASGDRGRGNGAASLSRASRTRRGTNWSKYGPSLISASSSCRSSRTTGFRKGIWSRMRGTSSARTGSLPAS